MHKVATNLPITKDTASDACAKILWLETATNNGRIYLLAEYCKRLGMNYVRSNELKLSDEETELLSGDIVDGKRKPELRAITR
jgi:hypothetical protein